MHPPPSEVFERSPALLAVATLDGTLVQINPALAAALGREPDELVGRRLADLAHPDDRADVVRTLSCGGRGEQRFAHADGSWLVLRWRAISTAAGDGLHVAADDVTAERLELNALASAIAHDLRSPARAIDGFSRVLLADREGLPEETARYLALVREAGSELAGLLDGLVRVMEVSHAPFIREEVDPAQIAREVVDLVLRPRQRDRDVTWVIDDLPPCRADVPLLRRLLEELLANALAFTTPNDGPARIEVAFDAGAQAYMIRDDGVGFDDALASRAFGIFERLHPREDFPGPGVGLAIAARIVARHGGRIWARSRPGEGATVWFTLI